MEHDKNKTRKKKKKKSSKIYCYTVKSPRGPQWDSSGHPRRHHMNPRRAAKTPTNSRATHRPEQTPRLLVYKIS